MKSHYKRQSKQFYSLVFYLLFYALIEIFIVTLSEGKKKNTYFYPHLVNKVGGGRPIWISERGGARSAEVDFKKK